MCPAAVHVGTLHIPAPEGSKEGWVPLLNTACPWADELEALYHCPDTAAVTTRTAYLHGPTPLDSVYDEDARVHQVRLSRSLSLNSFGYSPSSLRSYLARLRSLLKPRPKAVEGTQRPSRPKPVIVSLTGEPKAVALGLEAVCQLAAEVEPFLYLSAHGQQSSVETSTVLAVEVNLSCPNIRGTEIPPGFSPSFLSDTLKELQMILRRRHLTSTAWRPVTIGLKLPPYTYPAQFSDLVHALEEATLSFQNPQPDSDKAMGGPAHLCPVGFLTATNTLGGCLYPREEGTDQEKGGLPVDADRGFTGDGGMGGECLHPLSLGCVARLRRMLDQSPCASVREIALVAAGGCSSGEAVARFVQAGAVACGVATALGREGRSVFDRLRRETAAIGLLSRPGRRALPGSSRL